MVAAYPQGLVVPGISVFLNDSQLVESMFVRCENVLFLQLLATNVCWLSKFATMSFRQLKLLVQRLEMASLEGEDHMVEADGEEDVRIHGTSSHSKHLLSAALPSGDTVVAAYPQGLVVPGISVFLNGSQLVESMFVLCENVLFLQLLPTNVCWLSKLQTMSFHTLIMVCIFCRWVPPRQ